MKLMPFLALQYSSLPPSATQFTSLSITILCLYGQNTINAFQASTIIRLSRLYNSKPFAAFSIICLYGQHTINAFQALRCYASSALPIICLYGHTLNAVHGSTIRLFGPTIPSLSRHYLFSAFIGHTLDAFQALRYYAFLGHTIQSRSRPSQLFAFTAIQSMPFMALPY